MKPKLLPRLAFLCLSLIAANTLAQQSAPSAPVKTSTARPAVKVAPGTQFLFGTLAISTKSKDAKENLEMALEQYENAGFDQAVRQAEMATKATKYKATRRLSVGAAVPREKAIANRIKRAHSKFMHNNRVGLGLFAKGTAA